MVKNPQSNDFFTRWQEPSAICRSALFWGWNSKLTEPELRRQIGLMQAAGMGGFFMHSRIGLEIPYLSEEFFRMVEVCIDEAEKRGMLAELYDEDRWPSGGCGGRTAQEKAFRMRYLCAAYRDENPPITPETDKILGRFAVTPDLRYRKLSGRNPRLEPGERELIFLRRIASGIPWFNGSAPVDLLNPRAADRFIELTHEEYFQRFGKHFGKTVNSIFTDEPPAIYVNTVMNSDEKGLAGQPLPWTDRFAAAFRRRHGYSLLDRLPELWLPTARQQSGQLRRDYFDTVAHLLYTGYFQRIGSWCRKHHIAFTGHMIGEDKIGEQSGWNAEVMRQYRAMQQPGMDMLTSHWQHYTTAKQCSSAARQYGRKYRITETYGAGGWQLSLSAMKAIGEWQYALGINRRCLHVGSYSIKGERKRDFPPDFGPFSGNMANLRPLEDHFARLGAALSSGEELRDLLVIHPLEDAWRDRCGAELHSYGRLASPADKGLITLVNSLLAEHLDFDLGSEEILAHLGKVRKETLQVGKARYRAVLVPEMEKIRPATVALLHAFQQAGGKVFTQGEAFPGGIPITREKLADLSPYARLFSVADRNGRELPTILGQLRKAGGDRLFFACNTGWAATDTPEWAPPAEERNVTVDHAVIQIQSPRVRHVYLGTPATGEWQKIPFRYQDGMVIFNTAFGKLESQLYFLTNQDLPCRELPQISRMAQVPLRHIGTAPADANALVLDHALLPTGGIAEDKQEYILTLDGKFREYCSMQAYNWRAVQPYMQKKLPPGKAYELRYPFTVKEVPSTPLSLALEFGQTCSVFCNNIPLTHPGKALLPDGNALHFLEITPEMLKTGENFIVIQGVYEPANDAFEAMYLLGDFGVDAADTIGKLPPVLPPGDWTKMQFPYYSGSMVYTFEFTLPELPERLQVTLPEAAAFAVRFQLNDTQETDPVWQPFGHVWQSGFRKGKNILQVRICATRRNLMGPFYCRQKTVLVMPSNFRRVDDSARELEPYGLLALPEITAE